MFLKSKENPRSWANRKRDDSKTHESRPVNWIGK